MTRALALVLLVSGCYRSHGVGEDASPDARLSCSATFEGRDGSPVECTIDEPSRSCDVAARCICTDRLGPGFTPEALADCMRGERTLRALVTLADCCAPTAGGLDIGAAITGYFRGGATVSAGCASVPAVFSS